LFSFKILLNHKNWIWKNKLVVQHVHTWAIDTSHISLIIEEGFLFVLSC
jgi:hypothetical protein